MDEKQYISSVKLPDGSVYALKDVETRDILNSIFNDELIIDCGSTSVNFDDETVIDCGGIPVENNILV